MGIRKARGWIDWRHRVLPAPVLSSLFLYYYIYYLNYDIIIFYLNIFSLIVFGFRYVNVPA